MLGTENRDAADEGAPPYRSAAPGMVGNVSPVLFAAVLELEVGAGELAPDGGVRVDRGMYWAISSPSVGLVSATDPGSGGARSTGVLVGAKPISEISSKLSSTGFS